jgi:hypothetical protein
VSYLEQSDVPRWALPIIDQLAPDEKARFYQPYPDEEQGRQTQDALLRELVDMRTNSKSAEDILRRLKASIGALD